MIAAAFIDTNIFIYAASAAVEDQPRRRIAQKLIAGLDFAISAQVLKNSPMRLCEKNAWGYPNRKSGK